MEQEDYPKCGSDGNQRIMDLKNQTGRVILNYEDRQELLNEVKKPLLDEIKIKHVVSHEGSLWRTVKSINLMQLCQESIAENMQQTDCIWSNAKIMNKEDVFVIDRQSYLLLQHTQIEEMQRLAEIALKLTSIPSYEAAFEKYFRTIKRKLGDNRNRLGDANLFAELQIQTQLTQERQHKANLIKDQRNENLMKQKSESSHSSLIVATIKKAITKSQSQRAIKLQNKNDTYISNKKEKSAQKI
ncbi:MAG: hypothetical protein EZS28_013473 [Streblomastix strix]|uniref:Uncharacterized protein n=1 Tax=Streblomastix strix TaxID=222440 RepID=A0A5J4W928_9EUKA|nr:MAG: hypothetical protein EZS28_013473 [Streblomastix strix]